MPGENVASRFRRAGGKPDQHAHAAAHQKKDFLRLVTRRDDGFAGLINAALEQMGDGRQFFGGQTGESLQRLRCGAKVFRPARQVQFEQAAFAPFQGQVVVIERPKLGVEPRRQLDAQKAPEQGNGTGVGEQHPLAVGASFSEKFVKQVARTLVQGSPPVENPG